MCAINGITANDTSAVARMNAATVHRGPDGSHIYEGDGVTLGHNRLAIIDLSDQASQPMVRVGGRHVIVFNGEIYNYRELREELESAYSFQTNSDTEVLLAGYVVWGDDVLSKLRGIFAFGIWDTETETLTLVRDHMGVKPLYYRVENGVLSFSSELNGLLRDEESVVDKTGLSLFLELQYVASPYTLVEGVNKLPPGSLLRYHRGQMHIETYFKAIESTEPTKGNSSSLYETIDRAVERQLVSDRPIGMFLSGGLDSSIVLHHMAQHTDNVQTYSVGFEMVKGAEYEHDKFNADAILAERTARGYGARHQTFTLSLADVRDNLEMVLEHMDEPVTDPTSIAQYLLSKWVRADGTVVALGGDGGDELFGGYPRHRIAMAAFYYKKLPHLLQSLIATLYPEAKKLATPFPVPFHMALMALKDRHFGNILAQQLPLSETVASYLTDAYRTLPTDAHPVEAFMRIDRTTWLPDASFARSDRSSMAHGLEYRVPLVDLDVVAYADRIPVDQKVSPFRAKKILRATYRNHLPSYLFTQPKRGWISPGAKWLRDPVISAFVRSVFSSSYYDGLDGLFDWREVHAMLDQHIAMQGYHLHPLWDILTVQVWARTHKVRFDTEGM